METIPHLLYVSEPLEVDANGILAQENVAEMKREMQIR